MRPALIPLLALLLTACGGGVTAASPAGHEYLAQAVTGHDLVEGTELRLSFDDDGRLSASAGCNTLGGTWAIDDGRLSVGDLFTTEMGCDGPRHAQDEWLGGLLSAGPTVTLDGDRLTLATDEATIELLDVEQAEPDRALEGTTWEVAGFFDEEVASNLAVGTPATLLLQDGAITGFDGCADLTGTATVTGEGVDLYPEPAEGGADCPDATYAAMVREVLTTGVQWSVRGDALRLTSPHGPGLDLRAVGS